MKLFKRHIIFILAISLSLTLTMCEDGFDTAIQEEVKLSLENGENTNVDPPVNEGGGEGETDPTHEMDFITEVATCRAGAATTEADGYLYIYGGMDYDGVKGDFWKYNLDTGEYTKLTSDIARVYASIVELDGYIYIFGGQDSSGNAMGMFKAYNIATDSWYVVIPDPSMPPSAYGVAMVSYNNVNEIDGKRIFIHGGFSAGGGDAPGEIYQCIISGAGLEWSTVGSFSDQRGGHGAVLVNNEIYFFGGKSGYINYNSDIFKYDIENDVGSYVNSLGSTEIDERIGIGIVHSNGNLYVYGGNKGGIFYSDLWQFNLTSQEWTKISDFNLDITEYSSIIYDDTLYIYGGCYKNGAGQVVFKSNLYGVDLSGM